VLACSAWRLRLRRSRVAAHARPIATALAVGVFAVAAAPAHATLGQASSSIQTDQAHLSATRTSASASGYDITILTLPNTGVVREFTRQDGLVFAIAWRGPSRPDLRQLLGGYFATLKADTADRDGRARRMPLGTDRPDLVVHSAGRPGAFWGVAYLPQSAPASFSPDPLQ
jgi:hypothetical protein